MHRTRTAIRMVLVCALAAWAATGCDQTTDADAPHDISSRTQTINLDDAYGGYNTANEKPAFDDPYLEANYGPESNLVVATADSDTTRGDHARVHRYLMVTWGNLNADSLIDFSTDWSGSLCVEHGAMRALRTIRFEPGDHLLPRTSRSCVEWASRTQPSFDGILVSLLRAPCDSLAGVASTSPLPDSLCGEPISVTFKTGPLTVTFTQEELANLHKVIRVDDAGNAVAFNTIVVMPHECPHGFLAGQWKTVEGQRYAGVMRGEWMSDNGLHIGFMRGVFGANMHGDHVFFAKWISDDGTFKGIVKGRYGRSPVVRGDHADGWFDGVWYSRELRIAGGLHGVWGEGEKEGEGGFFRGAWGAHCRR